MHEKKEGEGSELKGKIKAEAGTLGGNTSTEVSATWDQATGEVQEKVEDATRSAQTP
jgi:uncharacterized protein YjbJ (UPF0337 family)